MTENSNSERDVASKTREKSDENSAKAIPSNPMRKRRRQERTEVTKSKLLEVAIREFSKRGFDAVTVREIETQAGVQRNLLNYHFGDKAGMWKATAAEIITRYQTFTDARFEMIQDLSVHERVAFLIRSYVRYCASAPEMNRLLIQEGKQDSWRIRWLLENFLRPSLALIQSTVEDDLDLNEGEFVHWYYMFVGGGSSIFSMAPEAALLFGVDVTEDEVIDRHAGMMVDFLLGRSTSK